MTARSLPYPPLLSIETAHNGICATFACLGSMRQEREQCEAHEPMLAHIVAGKVRHSGGEMAFGNFRIAELAPAPGAAEVQSIEMRDLSVAAVADDRRHEQRSRLILREVRQEP